MELTLLKAVALLSVLGHCSSQKGDCYYYFVRQPSPDTSCNPWPLLNNTTTLPLHCHIVAPKNDYLPNVEWYKDCEGTRMRVYPGGRDPKYSNPVSSGDMVDFKFVNFSLIIHNVSDSDVGCYWCEINVNAGEKCAFNIQPSSQFCLLEGAEYTASSGMSNCQSLPNNEEMLCVANNLCGSTMQIDQASISISKLMESSKTLSKSTRSTRLSENFVSPTKQSLMIDTSKNETNTAAVESTSASLLSTTLLSQQRLASSITLNSGPMINSLSDGMYMSSQPLNSESMETPLSQQELRVGLYVGVGVCCLLLVVILVLLAAVAVLCKAPRAKRREKESVAASNISSQPLNNAVWSRSNSAAMSVVNESSLHFITDSPILSTQLPPVSQGVRNVECTEVVAPRHFDSLSQTLSSMEEREAVIKSGRQHHRLSLTNESVDEQGQITAHPNERSGSPDSHYYHVLERPGYYNFNWLASDAEGRELLLQNWKEATANSQSSYSTPEGRPTDVTDQNPLPCTIEAEDRDGHHWKIVPPTIGKREGASSSHKSKRKHQYTQLDSTKMEPRREYARVSVKRTASPDCLRENNNN